MRFFILFFLVFSIVSRADDITLKEKLREAEPGSFLVLEQNNSYTFFHIFEINQTHIILEEVSLPVGRMDENCTWKSWFESGAPQHTSWTMSLINLDTGRFEEMYSFTHNGWIDTSKLDAFMTTLLNLCFEEIPLNQRRRIGLPPGYNKPDHRPIWNPRLVVNGEEIPKVYFNAWKARWPSDRSELARRVIEIYMPEEKMERRYPNYFPYLIEVEGKVGSAKVRVIDSGLLAKSPKERFPLRPPQLCGVPQLNEEGLFITLKAPSYFSDFFLFAEEIDGSFFTNPIPLANSTYRENETVILSVDRNTLVQNLKENSSYRFIITPKNDPSYCIETKQTFKFTNNQN